MTFELMLIQTQKQTFAHDSIDFFQSQICQIFLPNFQNSVKKTQNSKLTFLFHIGMASIHINKK